MLNGASATLGSAISPSHPFVLFFFLIFVTPSSESREGDRSSERSGILLREITAEFSGGTTERRRLYWRLSQSVLIVVIADCQEGRIEVVLRGWERG